MSVKYGRRGKEFHPEFVKYMESIVHHPNYKGMPWAFDLEGKIRWNAPSYRAPGGKWSNLHDERETWWRQKAKEIGIGPTGEWISSAAKMIHPFQSKPCQVCGEWRSLRYEYPTKRTVGMINQIQGLAEPLV